MGNRATVIFTDKENNFSPAVYLHWNGGAESVYGFLEEMNRRNIRGSNDLMYECARFIQICGEFFDQDEFTSTTLGVTDSPKSGQLKDLAQVRTDLGDNGIYLVYRTKDEMTVRRFHEDYTAHTMIELTPEEVATEKENAYKDDYGWLKDVFEKIAHGRKASKYG